MTEYIILRNETDSVTWVQHDTAEASSPERALRTSHLGEGIYVAVPLRSWKPLTVKVETVSKVTVG